MADYKLPEIQDCVQKLVVFQLTQKFPQQECYRTPALLSNYRIAMNPYPCGMWLQSKASRSSTVC